MMPWATQSYKQEALALSAQRLVNMYAEGQPPDAKTQIALIQCPGLSTFATASADGWRGMIVMGGILYGVVGPQFVSVSSGGTVTVLGTINTDSGRVSMATSGTQLLFVDGADGWGYTVAGGFQEITDPDFEPARSVAHQDGYFIFVKNDDSGQFFLSNLFDGFNYDALDFATAESNPDVLISCVSDRRELWLFGSDTTEIWYNSGNATFAFEPVNGSGASMQFGLGAQYSLVQLDNTLFWLGNDGVVYIANGYQPQAVSTPPINRLIRQKGDFSDSTAFAYTQDGHKFYCLNLPDEPTLCYDVTTGLWHERADWDGVGGVFTRWRPEVGVYVYGKNLVGDYQNGKVYQVDPDTFTYGGDPIVRRMTTPPITNNLDDAFIGSILVDFQAGVGLTTGQGSDPQAVFDWSDDGGYTWSNPLIRPIGKKGEYGAFTIVRRLGALQKGRVFGCTVSDPIRLTVMGAYMEAEV